MSITPRALDTVVVARGLILPAARPGAVIDFEVLPGETFAIVGEPAADRQALIEALLGIRQVTARELTVCGMAPAEAMRNGGRSVRGALRAVAFERGMTVADVLALFASFYPGLDTPAPAADLLGLRPRLQARVETLTPSETQRLVLTTAIMHDPILLVADDPTRDLGLQWAARVWDLLETRRARGRTTVLTTDQIDSLERGADRVMVLRQGRVAAVDTPERLLARCASPVAITVELPQRHALAPETLRSIEGVTTVTVDGDRIVLLSAAGFATMRELVRLLDRLPLTPTALVMKRPTLGDAITELLGQDVAE